MRRPLLLPAVLAVVSPQLSGAVEARALAPVIVVAPSLESPLTVTTDPKAPRQPLPAHDGADYLRTIPGFSVARKSGAGGDPLLRGMAGSRLNIVADGQSILGGCGGRMDAPTSYIHPEAFDLLTVIKGPQTVIHGAGNSAGTVLFERSGPELTEPGYRLHASALGASFGRHDEIVDGLVGTGSFNARLTATHSRSSDYVDGSGNAVHSRYRRYSSHAAFSLTPDADTLLQLSLGTGDGQAAYADRGMDGTRFRRDTTGLRFDRKNLSPLIEHLEAQVYRNAVDHVMDGQSLRTPGTMGYSNPRRKTEGARLAATLRTAETTRVVVGFDAQQNRHASRTAPATTGVYSAWAGNARFRQWGLFGELAQDLGPGQRLVAGYRLDRVAATDERAQVQSGNLRVDHPSPGQQRRDTLHSGFLRFEHTPAGLPVSIHAGVGRSARAPDYWELVAKQGPDPVRAFAIAPETTHQLDAGLIWKTGQTRMTLSAFYNRIGNFILVDYTAKPTGAARSVDAQTHGAELGVEHALTEHWKLGGSLAWVHGSNLTDKRPLAQLPPFEGRLGLHYDNAAWSFGVLARAVAAQRRFDLGRGTIVGRDLGPSAGFTVVSANAGWRPGKTSLLSAGVDNLLNRTYAEFVSRAGVAIPGYAPDVRVNEAGRTFWLKAQISFG